MSRSHWLVAVLFLSLSARPALAQVPLAWRLQEKDQWYVEWKSNLVTSHKIGAQKDWKSQTEQLTALYRVTVLKRLPDGGTELEIVVESVTGAIPPEKVNPRQLQGYSLRVALDAHRNVTLVDGLDAVVHKRFGAGSLPPQAAFFRTELEDTCRLWVQDVFIPLPGPAAQAGAKWQQQTERALVPLGRHMLCKTFTEEGKVAGGGRELTRLNVTGASSLFPYADGEFNVPYKVTRAEFRSARYTGTYFFDPAAGRLVQGGTQLRTSLHVVLTAGGRDHEGEAEQEQVTSVRVLDQKPTTEALDPTAGDSADAPYRRLLGADDSKQAAAWEKRTEELTEAGLWAEALKLARQVLALRVRVQGAGHWQAADAARNVQTLEKLAALPDAERAEFLAMPRLLAQAADLHVQGKHDAAAELRDRAWSIRGRIFGEDHHSTPRIYLDLAARLGTRGKPAEAELVYGKALDIARRVLGEEHPDTARAYNELGCLLLAQGKPAEAEPPLRRAVALRGRLQGPEHPDVARACDNLGVSLNHQGRADDAQPCHQRALALLRRTLGDDAPETLECAYNLAVNLLALNRPAEAEPLLRRTLAFRLRTLGEAHLATALSYSNLAASLQRQNRLPEAEPLLRKSLEIHRRVLGEGHMDTIRTYVSLGQLLRAVGKEQEGQELQRRGEDLFRQAPRG